MPSTYARADSRVQDIVDDIKQRFHSDLDTVDAKFDILFAFRDPEKDDPALLKDGQRILGYAKPTSLKDKAKGLQDGEIVLDGDAWQAMTAMQKAALVDHVLSSFEAKRDKKGEFIMDDFNRPKLGNRPHDRVLRMYDAVAIRHGDSSIEHAQMDALFTQGGATYLPAPGVASKVINEEGDRLVADMHKACKEAGATVTVTTPEGKSSIFGATEEAE